MRRVRCDRSRGTFASRICLIQRLAFTLIQQIPWFDAVVVKYLVLDVVFGILIGRVLDLGKRDVRSCGVT